MIIDKTKALAVLEEEAQRADASRVDGNWGPIFNRFSEVCEEAPKTHIAFLGTALLAKAVDKRVDAFAVKAGAPGPGAYSARSLAHGVLVPNALRLGINLGVTGREPLNNQPYFRILVVSPDIPVHPTAKAALKELCRILQLVNQVESEAEARTALRAFIAVRRRYSRSYEEFDGQTTYSLEEMIDFISEFVGQDSEGGKRAQAVVAGLMDLVAPPECVLTGRVNDPDRRIPGDVGIARSPPNLGWEKLFEVRDKQVTESDLYHFAQKSADNEVAEAAVIAVAKSQESIDSSSVKEWAIQRKVTLTIFYGWAELVPQVLFWAEISTQEGLRILPARVDARLIDLEVSAEGIEEWRAKFASA